MSHHCTIDAPKLEYGQAFKYCKEEALYDVNRKAKETFFIVSNDEYGSVVNFCPVCGEKAPNTIEYWEKFFYSRWDT